MATGMQNAWSTTPATNGTADSAVPAFEGQGPSTLNAAIRAMMAFLKKTLLDTHGSIVTTGISTAYVLATNEGLTLADGITVACRMSLTNGASPTLNVDSTGAVAIQGVVGTAVPTGTLLAGAIYEFTYYAAGTAWLVRGISAVGLGAAARPFAATTRTLFFQTLAPTGWTKDTALNNGAIRMVSGTVDSDGGSQNFTDVFASRTIAQANLPAVNLSTASITFSPTTIVTGVSAPTSQAQVAGGSPVTVVTSVTPTTASPTFGGSVPLGGSGTAMSWAVKYANAIRATID